MFLCTNCRDYEEVNIIKRSDFVPSLQLLSAEALVNHDKFEKFDLKRLGLLEKYVREIMSLDDRGHVVDEWQLRKLERPLYMNEIEPLYEGLSDLDGFTDCVVEEVKRNYNISDDKFHIDVMPQLEGITEVPHRGWLIKLGGVSTSLAMTRSSLWMRIPPSTLLTLACLLLPERVPGKGLVLTSAHTRAKASLYSWHGSKPSSLKLMLFVLPELVLRD